MGDNEEKFLAQFGSELYEPATKEMVKPESVLSGKKVMLYFSGRSRLHGSSAPTRCIIVTCFGFLIFITPFFSFITAHWCPPCRRFTPVLISLYKKLKEDPQRMDTFELVFVSLDRDEDQFNEYTADMPWKCVPFSAPPEMRQKLAMKYKAEGIPHLVVLDEQRNVITLEGTGEVSVDPEGEKFPWKPKTFSEIWPTQVLTKSGLIDSSTLDTKHLMLYFSGRSASNGPTPFTQDSLPHLW